MAAKKSPKIVVVGGGTGIFSVLLGLKQYASDITAVVTMADDGGSTGMLREDFGILPPGDVRRALVALASADNAMLSQLFNYRFAEGVGLEGHSFGNLMLTALERITGNFESAIGEAERLLGVTGRVLPVTLTHARLCAELENGAIIKGETNIDIPKHDGRLRIERAWLEPVARINPRVARAIKEADAVVIGPGDLWTSIMPNLMVRGMRDALTATRGKVMYVANLMTKFGETNHFALSNFLRVIEGVLGKGVIEYCLVNDARPSPRRLAPYVREAASLVQHDEVRISTPLIVTADLIRPRGMIRHDPEKNSTSHSQSYIISFLTSSPWRAKK